MSISGRLILLVLALALPLNLIIAGVIWGLVTRANDAQRTSLLYAARSVAAGVDAKLGKFVALAESLAHSPALLDDNLDAFEAEARREFPEGGSWVLVADVNGQQLINTLAQPGAPLPRRNPPALEAQQRALATGSIVISDVLQSLVAGDWVANIEVPIFKNGQPFRGLAVGIRGREFLPLLSAPDIPKNWLASIIDGDGRFIARVPKGATEVGQLASQGWRAIKDRTGLFEYPSLEGDTLITANAHPSNSNWAVGVAVKKAELRALAWNTVRWAVMLGAGFSAASLLLAGAIARQITRPINRLRQAFADASAEPGKPIESGPPEILELQDTLHRATLERANANQALRTALSNLEGEITLREEAQAGMAQAQRLETIGQLAGGIAHDFNNVLAAISSNVDMVTLPSADEKKIRELVQNAMDAIQMGASLTRRLLLLSSQHEVGLERLDLNDHVTGTIELLRRTLGEQVTVSLRLSPDPCQTSANLGDIDNAIINLAINARDAMPSGGMLTIETRRVTIDADAAGCIANARPGEYVMLTISDTGHGMSPEVLKHAMEPFFTTKEPGKGTGLGLATVHSTARQSGGFVAIDSTEGEGTSVHVYFPKAEPGPIVSRAAPSPKEAPLGDGELILLVEDNDKVRESTANRFESLGYAVLEANTGPEAITLLGSGEPIALVFSDIVMPGGMTGYDLAERVRSMRPELKVVLTSGSSDVPLAVSEAARKIKVLAKPYTRAQLACALREALEG